jgi:hypothetical protein
MKRERSSQGSPALELDEQQLSRVVGGRVSDDGDLTGIPPWAWPIIRVTDLESTVNPVVIQKKAILR